jgi:hypothetical protein
MLYMKSVENTPQVIYRYSWYWRWFTGLFNVSALLALLLPVFFMGALIFGAMNGELPVWAEGSLSRSLLYLLLIAICGSVTMALTGNFLPEIRADQNGLQVSFLWYRLPVPWQDIVGIKPFFGVKFQKRPVYMWVVRTRALTPLHRLYGLIYGFTFSPSFIVISTIENYVDLIRKINQRRFK